MQTLDIQIRNMATPTLGRHTMFLGTDKLGATIGSFTSIAGGVYIHSADNHAIVNNPEIVSSFDFPVEWGGNWPPSGTSKGPVIIGSDVWIGEFAQILTGVTIGDGAIIGAHTVIAKDVPPYAVVVGNPQVIKKYRYSPEIIEKLLKIKWWDWDNQTIRTRIPDMLDVYKFVDKYYDKENKTT